MGVPDSRSKVHASRWRPSSGARARRRKRPLSGWALKPAAALAVLASVLWACVPVAHPVVKIGLVAPFEGRYRDLGYEVIYAVRLAVREANAAGGLLGHDVELVALDDGGSPEAAAEQARKLSVDAGVLAVVGHWLDPTTLAAAPVYSAAGLPWLATTTGALPPGSFRLWLTPSAVNAAAGPEAQACPAPCDSLEDLAWLHQVRAQHADAAVIGPPLWGQPQFTALAGADAEGAYFVAPAPYPSDSTDPAFAERYAAISGGVEPRFNAVLAYDAAHVLFAAIERSLKDGRQATRAGVAAALAQTDLAGLSGHISFDAASEWTGGRAWVYQWRQGQPVRTGEAVP